MATKLKREYDAQEKTVVVVIGGETYTILQSEDFILVSQGNLVLPLSENDSGDIFVMNKYSGDVVVTRQGSDTINGRSSFKMGANVFMKFTVQKGIGWLVEDASARSSILAFLTSAWDFYLEDIVDERVPTYGVIPAQNAAISDDLLLNNDISFYWKDATHIVMRGRNNSGVIQFAEITTIPAYLDVSVHDDLTVKDIITGITRV